MKYTYKIAEINREEQMIQLCYQIPGGKEFNLNVHFAFGDLETIRNIAIKNAPISALSYDYERLNNSQSFAKSTEILIENFGKTFEVELKNVEKTKVEILP